MRKLYSLLQIFLFTSALFAHQNVQAQAACAGCTATTFNVNLSAATDTSWSIASTRNGTCCGITGSNCIVFNVTLNPASDLLSFNVTNPSPPGSGFYQINCGPQISIGTPACVNGLTTLCITYCKPGGDSPTYHIVATRTVEASPDITIREGCTGVLSVNGLQPASIQWNSIAPGSPGDYNSYLSCTSGCATTNVTPTAGAPTFVDYVVTGNPNTACPGTSTDTVRVYITPPMFVNISPLNPVVCSGGVGTVTLTANVTGGAPPYTYSWSPGGQTTPSINVGAGTYTVSVMDTTTACPPVLETIIVTAEPTPAQPVVTTNSPVCVGQTINLSTPAVAGATYDWTGPNGFTSTLQNPSITNAVAANAGTYSLTVTVNGCTSTAGTATVTVNPIPAAPTAGSNSPICAGQTLNLTASNIAGASYNWTGPNGFTATTQNPSIPSATTAAAGTYSVTATVNGCTGLAGSVSVTVNPIPAAPTAAGTTICSGNSIVLTATAPGGNYQWFNAPTGGTLLGSGNTYTTPILNTTTSFYVQTTVNGCVSPRTEVIVTVNPTPAAPTASGTTICEGNTTTLTTTAPGGTYEWFDLPSGGTLLNTGANYTTPVLTTSTDYYVQTTINGCTSPMATVSVTVTPTDDATFSYSSSTYCITGTNPTPTINGPHPGTFTSSPAGLNINASTGTIDVASSSLNTYTVTFTTSGPCPNSSSVSITITNAPDATFSYSTPVCQGGTNILPVFPPGASTGVFSASPSGINFVSTSTGEINLTTSTPGTYTVTNFIAAAGGCASATANFSITIEPAATVDAGTYSAICAGNVINLNGSFGGSATSATWSGSGTFSPNTTTMTATYTPSAGEVSAGEASVTLTTNSPGGVCPAASETVLITITSLPAAPTVSGTTICEGNTATLTATAPGGNYQWYNLPSGGTLLATGATYTTAVLNTTTTYYVQTTVGGCAGPRTAVTVTVILNDNASFAYSSGTYCITGTDPTPTITGTTGGTFNSNPTGLTLNTTTGEITLSTSALGTYMVYYTTNGACPMADSTAVTITTAPDATFSYNGPYCQFTTNPLPAFPPGSSAGVFSATPAGLNFASTSTGEINLSNTAAGTYSVTNFIASAGGCASATHTASVTIEEAAIADAGLDQTLCVGATVNLSGAISGSATSASWSGGAGSFSPGNTNLNASYTPTASEYANGSVVLILTTNAPGGVCQAGVDFVTINFIEDDPSFTYSSGTYCITGTNPTPTLTGGFSGTFSASPSGLAFVNTSTGQINLSGSSLGTYTVTFTTNGPCPASSSVSVTITDSPDATFSYNSPVCAISANIFPIFPPGASAGVFSATPVGLVFVSTSTGEINVGASVPGTYTITNFIAPAVGCASASHSSTLTIDIAPTVDAGSNISTCFGSTVNLSGMIGGSASSATWSGGLGSFSPSPNNLNTTYTPNPSETSVTLYLTTNNPSGPCVAVMDSLVITINPIPPAPTAADVTICEGNTATLTATAPGGTYQWFTQPTGGSQVGSGASFTTPVLTTTTSYYVQATISGCPSNTRTEVVVTVIPIDDPSFSYTSATYCISGSNPVAVISGGSSGTFTASPVGVIFADNSTGEIDVANTAIGTYTITFTTDGTCPDSSSVSITITDTPDATFSYNDPFCTNGSNPSPIFPPGASAGTFMSNPPGLVFVNPGTGQINLSASTPGTYTVTNDIPPAAGCAGSNHSETVEILAGPTVDAGLDVSVCENNALVNLSGAFSNAGGIVWTSSGNGVFMPDDIILITDYIPGTSDISTGSVTIYLTTTQNGICNAETDSLTVTITAQPNVNAGNTILICDGSNQAPLNGSVSGAASTGVWSSSGTGTFTPSNTALNGTYSFSPDDILAGSVMLYLESTNNGNCLPVIDSVLAVITTTAVVDAGNDTTVCYSNGGVQLSGQVTGATGEGMWISSGSGTFSPDNEDLNAIYVPDSTDLANGTVTLILEAINSCDPASDTITITLLPDAMVNAGSNQAICYNEVVNLNGQIDNAAGGTWTSTGDGVFSPSNSALSGIYTPGAGDIASGSVSLTLISTGQLCLADTAAINISIGEHPEAAFTHSAPCAGEPIQFTDESTIGSGSIVAWNWDFEFGTDTLQNPSFTFASPGNVNVSLIVYSQNVCTDTVAVQLQIEDCGNNKPVVPTAFTPNGDGNNDLLFVRGGPFLELDFRVFNEWGNQIFHTTDQSIGWNGTYKNKMQPQGTYVWTIKVLTMDNEEIELNGEVTILK
ncbi:MAG: gliding motility-associated C-terminal domain-containing protein [Flavobacteriales bacterium]